MKKLLVSIVLLFLLALGSSVSADSSAVAKTFQPTIYPWVFFVPKDVTPTLKYVMWGYYGSPKDGARSIAKHVFESPVDNQTPNGMKAVMVRLTSDISLKGFELKWINRSNVALSILKTGDAPGKKLDPKVRVGVTLDCSFAKGDDIYSTEVVVPNTNSEVISPFLGESGELRSTVNGLVFSLTEKEMRARKIFNVRTKSWVPTTEWQKNGKPLEN